jgi:type VI secretion system protein ImpF
MLASETPPWAFASLLDRLRDDRPDQRLPVGAASGPSAQALKESVRAELTSLLNAVAFDAARDLDAFPRVRASSLNYGVLDLTGRSRSGISATQVEARLRSAIRNYEPRLDSQTLAVSCSAAAGARAATELDVRIEADLRGAPTPTRLRFRTHWSLEDGGALVEGG